MAVWSNIKLSQIQEFNRTDAEFYKPDYLASFQHLLSVGGEKISNHAYVTDGIHASPQIVENGIRYISAKCKCVKDNEFVIDNCINISPVQNEQNPRTQLSIGDVIITTVGTIGNVAVVEEDLTPCNCDRHVGIIRIKNPENLSPFYLSTFLNSRYGKLQSLRESAGNVQLNLYIRNIGHLVIPRLGDEEFKIANLTKQAYQLRSLSKKHYSKAQQLLESELGLDQLSFQKPVGYTARFSEVAKSLKISSYFYQPKYSLLEETIKSNSVPLKHIVVNHSSGFAFKKAHITKNKTNYPLIKIQSLSPSLVVLEGNDFVTNDGRVAGKTEITQLGDVLISLSGTVGVSSIVRKKSVGASINQRILRVKLKNISPEYLTIVLNSIVGKMQFERIGTGGVQTNVSSNDVLKILIPRLDEKIENQITELISKSYDLKTQSEQLLEQAKTRVEQLIEEAVQA